MAVSDDRITIRNKLSGELGHGIAGHVPAGFEEVKADKGDSVADRDLAGSKAGYPAEETRKRAVQDVRGKTGSDAGKRVSARPESGPVKRKMDGK